MELAEFKAELRSQRAVDLARAYARRSEVHAFKTPQEYLDFCNWIGGEIKHVEAVFIAGSGNWKFSLNPGKGFREFHDRSDLDVAVISNHHFNASWEEIRKFHRQYWYKYDPETRLDIRRKGENVYAGFVSPNWVPERASELRYSHRVLLNRLSNGSPGKREVTMLFFKNEVEALAYYERGFEIARQKVS